MAVCYPNGKKTSKAKKDHVLSVATRVAKKNCLSWYDKLDQEDQKWLDELKAEIKAGKHYDLNCESLAKAVSNELGIRVLGSAFRNWMRK